MYSHTITIINIHNYKGIPKEYKTVLEGVHYQDKQGVKTGSTEHFTDNQGYVQIPHLIEGYLPPNEWLKLSDKSKHWTIKENDFVFKGGDLNVTSESYGVRTIDSWENIDYGLFIPGHYGVTLK